MPEKLSDKDLSDFLTDPKAFSSNILNKGKIFDGDPNAKAKFGSILQKQGLSESEIKKRLDAAAMVRLKEVDIYL